MELTKEYFDKQFSNLNGKFVTKDYFDKQFKVLSTNFVTKEYLDEILEKKFNEKLEPINIDIRSIKNDVKDIKNDVSDLNETVLRIDKRDLEDSNAFKTIVLNHNRRLKVVEKALKVS